MERCWKRMWEYSGDSRRFARSQEQGGLDFISHHGFVNRNVLHWDQ